MHGHVVLLIRVIFIFLMDHGVRSRRKLTVTAYGKQLLSRVGSSSLASRYVIERNLFDGPEIQCFLRLRHLSSGLETYNSNI